MNLLEVRNVSKQFGSLKAVQNVSLSVAPGELRAIIGPNGAGKTTFFNLVSGLFSPNAGTIAFDGEDITTLPAHARVSRGIARTFQVTEIFPELSVYENVRISAEVAAGYRQRTWLGKSDVARVHTQVNHMLELAGLQDRAGRRVGELSHGDQRAEEIAMALALRPRLLLPDEPTAGMGEQETYEIAQLVRGLHREHKHTIVLIEHDMRVVFHREERVTVLDQGRLLADGTPQDISANEAVQSAYLGKTA